MVSGLSWKEAFMDTLPKRKMFSVKDEENSLLDYEDCSLNAEQIIEENKCIDVEKNEYSNEKAVDNSVEKNTTI